MINEQQWIDIILDWFPDFRPQYQEHLDEWKDDPERPFGLDMAEFTRYAVDLIQSGSDELVVKLTDFAELMITEGNESVDYAVCMMFLENITNKNGGSVTDVMLGLLLGK